MKSRYSSHHSCYNYWSSRGYALITNSEHECCYSLQCANCVERVTVQQRLIVLKADIL